MASRGWPLITPDCPYLPLPRRGHTANLTPERDCPSCDNYIVDHRGQWVCRPNWREGRQGELQ